MRNTLLTVGVAAAISFVFPPTVDAQFGQQRKTERVLVLIPNPLAPGDTTFAVQFANEVRRRMEGKFRNKLTVISTEQISEMLAESGYQPAAILGRADAERLARALRSDAYIEGDLGRGDLAPLVHLRMVDIGRSGLSGWVTVRGTAELDPKKLAEIAVDSLDPQVDAAEEARECTERRDRGDFRGARDRAERAFRLYPNHPSAALCAAVVMEAMNAPADSQVAMYRRAASGDSLLSRAWERLGRLYQQQGDSLKALDAFASRLLARPGDRQLRLGIAAGYMTVGQYSRARTLMDEWLLENPGDQEFLDLKVRACVEGELWICALDALGAQYRHDSALVGDTIFYATVIGAAQQIDNMDALLEWTGEAVRNAPTCVSCWRGRANAFREAGQSDSVIVAYERILELVPGDVATRLGAAQAIIEGITIDTTVVLDTARLLKAGQYLDQVAAMSRDTAVLMNAAVLYYQPTTKMVQYRMHLPIAIDWLEKALRNDVQNRLTEQANFFLGFGLMFQIFEFDQRVTESKSCSLVQQEAELVARGKRALEIGASVSPQTAQQFLQQYRTFEQRIPQLRAAFCR
jgi:tetratricopeptide (TPR) repeat protein